MYLLTSSIAYAKLANCDKPFMVAGAVTDGYRYNFLVCETVSGIVNYNTCRHSNLILWILTRPQ